MHFKKNFFHLSGRVLFLSMALVGGVLLGYAARSALGIGAADNWGKQSENSVSLANEAGNTRQKENRKSDAVFLSLADRELLRISVMRPEVMLQELEKRGKNKGNKRFRLLSDTWVMDALFDRLGRTIPLQSLQIANKSSFMQDRGIPAILESWSVVDPKAAYKYCQDNLGRDSISFRMHKGAILSQFPFKEGIKVLVMDRDPWEQGRTLECFIWNVTLDYPERIPELVNFFENHVGGDDNKECIAGNWMALDSKAAMNWINTLPEQSRERVLFNALQYLPWEEGTRALASMQIEEKERALHSMAMSLFRKDTVKTLEWLQETVEEKRILALVEREFDTNNVCDPLLSEYVSKMEEGDLKDALLAKMVKKMSALSWENSTFLGVATENIAGRIFLIKSEEKKEVAFKDLMWSRFFMDADKAKQWVAGSRMSEDEKRIFVTLCDGYKDKQKME